MGRQERDGMGVRANLLSAAARRRGIELRERDTARQQQIREGVADEECVFLLAQAGQWIEPLQLGIDEAGMAHDDTAVRKAVEKSFGPDALHDFRQYRRPARRFPPWRRHIEMPFTPRAKGCLEGALKEAVRTRTGYVGTEHLAQSALAMKSSSVPRIVAALGVDPAALRTVITDKYRKAS